MRYAIISDVHANLEALTAVMEECRRLKAQVICLGDIVGYGANPRECVNLIRRFKIPTVAGNHDWALAGRLDASHFTDDGKAALSWTRGQLDLEEITYLQSLPLSLKNKDMVAVHGSLNQPQTFEYLIEIGDAPATFEHMDRPLCMIGHTHVPTVFCQQEGRVFRQPAIEFDLREGARYIVNPGSVGQPRDGNPLASFALFDGSAKTMTICRVPYDILTAQRKIVAAGLPRALAERLSTG